MSRKLYDLSHYVGQVGQIGRLTTLSAIPVLPGDSIGYNFTGGFRLSPLRRAISIDTRVDIASFFVPHRHAYGQEWIDFIKQGANNPELLLSSNFTTADVNTNLGYIPLSTGATPNNILPHGYAAIYNNYYRVPNADDPDSDLMDPTVIPTDTKIRDFGMNAARLPTMLTTGSATDTDAANYDVPVDPTTGMSLFEIAQVKQTLKSSIQRDWFTERYRDLLSMVWDTNQQVSTDADQRPTLLKKQETWLSGYDVDGTDDATLGSYTGKSQGLINYNLPSKYFNEHGTLFTMALVRFPPIFNTERNPVFGSWSDFPQNYDHLAGDPNVFSARRPVDYLATNYISYAGLESGTLGYQPFGQWYRSCPNFTHPLFRTLPGYPFIDLFDAPAGWGARFFNYENSDAYDMFQSMELAHWNVISKMTVQAKRNITPATDSIFTGTDLSG